MSLFSRFGYINIGSQSEDNPMHTTTDHEAAMVASGAGIDGLTASDRLQPNAEEISSKTALCDESRVNVMVASQAVGASRFSCCINLGSTIVGAGLLGMPYAVSNAGWILGTFLLVSCGLLSAFGLHLLAACAIKHELPSSFYSVAERAAPGWSWLVDVAIAIKCFGIATSYLIVIGDSMPKAFRQLSAPWQLQDRSFCILLSLAILGPLSSMSNFDSLRYSSAASALMILAIVIVVVLFAVGIPQLDPCGDHDGYCGGETSLFAMGVSTVRMIPVYCFGFSCQQNTFGVVNELRNPTQRRLDQVFVGSVACAVCVYLVFAYAGYATFGDRLVADIITMYPEVPVISACRMMVSVVVSCHYPLQLHPARRSILSLLAANQPTLLRFDERATARIYFAAVTTTFLAASTITALSVTDLGVAFAVVGATGSTLVIFLLPGFFFHRMFRSSTDPGVFLQTWLALGMVAIGLVVMILSLTLLGVYS